MTNIATELAWLNFKSAVIMDNEIPPEDLKEMVVTCEALLFPSHLIPV